MRARFNKISQGLKHVAKSDTKVHKGRGRGKWRGSNEYVKDNSSAHGKKELSNDSEHHQNYADSQQRQSSQNQPQEQE